MTLFHLSYAGLWFVALILAVLVTVMVSQFSALLRLAETYDNQGILAGARQLTSGAALRSFGGRDIRSGAIRTSDEWLGAPFVVVALSPTCGACKTFVSELLSTGDVIAGKESVIGICVGDKSACETSSFAAVRSIPVLTVAEADVPEMVVTGLPLAIAVRADGIVTDVRHPTAVSEVAAMLAALRDEDRQETLARANNAHAAARPDVARAS